MATIYDNREPQQDSNIAREPLVNVAVEPAQTGGCPSENADGGGSTYKSRRRCLSDLQDAESDPGNDGGVETPDAGARVEASPEGLTDLTALPEEPSPAGRPRMPGMRAVREESPPRASDTQPMKDEPVAEQPECRPKAGRPRLTHSQAQGDVPQAAQAPEGPAKGHRRRLGQEKPQPTASEGGTPPLPDMVRLEQSISRLRARQNLTLAIVGLLAAVAGILAWLVVTGLIGNPIA